MRDRGDHARKRKIVSHTFSAKSIGQFEQYMVLIWGSFISMTNLDSMSIWKLFSNAGQNSQKMQKAAMLKLMLYLGLIIWPLT